MLVDEISACSAFPGTDNIDVVERSAVALGKALGLRENQFIARRRQADLFAAFPQQGLLQPFARLDTAADRVPMAGPGPLPDGTQAK